MQQVMNIFNSRNWAYVFPWFFSAMVILVNMDQQWIHHFTYQRTLINTGQIWRLFTGPWIHGSTSHLFWDVSTFLVLAGWCFVWSPKRSMIAFTTGMLTLPIMVYGLYPQIQFFYGISGLSSLYFTMFCAILIQSKTGNQGIVFLGVLGLGLFFMKMIFEASTGTTLFLDSSVGRPLVLIHLTGAVFGLIYGFTRRERTLQHENK